MATILTHEIINNAKESVDTYISTANNLYDQLSGVINSLIGTNFSGDAADGYKFFFDSKVVPALTDNLTSPESSLTAGIKNILEGIENQLLDTVDPQLGDANRNPGGEQA